MRACLIGAMWFAAFASASHAVEPTLIEPLRPLTWLVGDWSMEKIWTKEALHSTNRFVRGIGNPHIRITVAEGGGKLRVTYGYRIIEFDELPDLFGEKAGVEYRCDELIGFAKDCYTLDGRLRRSDKRTVEMKYHFDIQPGCTKDWAERIPGTDLMTLVCGEPGSPIFPVFITARRDDRRALPNYRPFTPQSVTSR